MAWLIIALGAALATAGALSLGSGLPYMRIEWGWTEVIAGTTAISGGVVTIALGAVLLRLGSLRRVLEKGLAALPRAAPGDALLVEEQAPSATLDALPPTVHPEPADTANFDSTPPIPEPVQAPLLAPMEQAGHAYQPKLEIGSPADAEAALAPVPQAAKRKPLLAQLRDNWGGRGKPTSEPVARPDEPKLDAGLASSPLADQQAPPVGLAEPWPASSGKPGSKPSGAASEPELATPFPSIGGEDSLTAPSEVGRYEAGGASYALFSDGTIEVETETGLHRFASMDQLKAFIDQKDRAAATPDR